MVIRLWDKKLSEFLDLCESQEVQVNRRYQRSRKVWPDNARSYLVETVILNLALPHLMLHKVPAKRGKPEHTDIVDGQQRTVALSAFRKDEFKLSSIVDTAGLKGKKYSTLTTAQKRTFDSYTLRMERFEDAGEPAIREVFRRINSFTAPLNPEEQRHAQFQGEFKWFIHKQTELFGSAFRASGVLSEKQVNRMADAKLLTEVVHAMVYGVTTTSARVLRKLYRTFDREFEIERDFTQRLTKARTQFSGLGPLPRLLAKPFHAYSLLLSILFAQERVPALADVFGKRKPIRPGATIARNLLILAEVLDMDEDSVPARYKEFYVASGKGTNVRAARITRCQWFYRALTEARLKPVNA